jgi:hypothetical protein
MSESSMSKPCEHDVGDPALNERMLGGCLDEKADLYCAGRRKLYICKLVSEVDEEVVDGHTLHSLHLPPTASHRPRQPRGWLVHENIIVTGVLMVCKINWRLMGVCTVEVNCRSEVVDCVGCIVVDSASTRVNRGQF